MKRQKQRKVSNTKGFTLIEVLTVIAIITVLAGLLFPAISGSIRKGKSAVARTDVKAIETAVRQYYTEYGKLPLRDYQLNDPGDYYFNDSSDKTQNQLMDTLRAITGDTGEINELNLLNPRKIVFLDTPGRSGAFDTNSTRYFRDPWGIVYTVALDRNYDNQVENTPVVVIARSAGPDKNLGTSDDIESHK